MSLFLYTPIDKNNHIEEVKTMAEEGESEIEIRKKIYNYISTHPGINKNEISSQLNIQKNIVDNNLNFLEKLGLISSDKEKNEVLYYIPKKIDEFDKKIISLIKQDVPFKIIIYLLLNPNSSHINICRYLRRHPETIGFHLKKLMDTDIVICIPNGRERYYKVKNEDTIIDLIYKYKDSCFDDTLDYLDYNKFKLY